MFYQFPHISRIEQVLEAIKNSDDFRVTQKDGYQVIQYNLANSTTFPQIKPGLESFKEWKDIGGGYATTVTIPRDEVSLAIRRECRGLIFDNNGNLIRRAFHKFFNLNEREETLIENVDFNEPHVILEKLDGSMITPLFLPDSSTGKPHLRLATKAGITDVAMEAEVFIATKPHYKQFMEHAYNEGYTPIFEYISPDTQIVIRHKEPNLILTAIRNNLTGEYLEPAALRVNALRNNIPLVNTIGTFCDEQFIDDLERKSDTEGIVIRFYNGHMIKVKTFWYLAIHRAKDNLLYEKRVIELILEEKVDDVLPFLSIEDKTYLEEYRDKFVSGLNETITLLSKHYYPRAKRGTRKEFALGMAKELPGCYASVVFSCWESGAEEIEPTVREMIKNALTSQTKIDKIRSLFGNVQWKYRAKLE